MFEIRWYVYYSFAKYWNDRNTISVVGNNGVPHTKRC